LTVTLQLSLKSSTQKYKPIYKLKVLYEPPPGPSRSNIKWEDKEFEGSFTEWFSKEGYLQQKELKSWLARNIEVVGLADPTSKQSVGEAYEDIVDDAVLASIVSSSESQTPSQKAKKSRKKA
jgi:Microsomal signal peptidase 25 kDa subunit (SPC25)